MTAKGMSRAPSKDATAHRELIVTDPPMLGKDVEVLKTALRERLKARGLDDDVRIGQHDKFTYATWLACVEIGYALGLNSDTYLARDKGRGSCTIGAQRIIRDPDTRTEKQRFNAKARADRVKEGPRYLDELTDEAAPGKGTGADAAIAYLRRYVGVHERPAQSNSDRGSGAFGSGPVIDKWIRAAGYNSPVPWCGVACNAGIMAGGLPSGASWTIGFVPAIVTHAKAGRDGWRWIAADSGRRGDLACFLRGGEYVHVETVDDRVNATTYKDIGGNTGGTNPADGGMLAETIRYTTGSFKIGGHARPPYKS